MTIPNFLIGGTGNAGTSFLLSALMQHKDIYVPLSMRPEPHYFYYNHHYSKGLTWYSKTWFSQYDKQHAIGERSSSYLFGKKCAQRIAQDLPTVKLIFILRNPVERTWSNYRFTILNGLENLSFKKAIETEKERSESLTGFWKEVLPFSYKSRSLYGEQIRNYLQYFNHKQILIISSEMLRANPIPYINKVCDFIGVKHMENIELPSDFSSLDIKSADIQFECRKYFDDRFNIIVENLRKGEEDKSILSSQLDYSYYDKLKNNCTNTKQKISASNRLYLQNLLEKDSNLFFSLMNNYIDFDQSVWSN